MKKIEHIGIAVANADKAISTFNALFNAKPYKTEKVQSEGVNTYFYQMGESKIELLEATNPESPIAKFLANRKEGILHLAFHVEDIHAEIKRLVKEGFNVLGEVKKGADNKLICFLHPKTTNGVLGELCQEANLD